MSIKSSLLSAGLRLLRTKYIGAQIVRLAWPIMVQHLPQNVLRQSERLVAFFHPSPAYPFHVLLVPKKTIPSLGALGMEDQGLLVELVQMVSSLVIEFGLEENGYRLIVNGGKYQEAAQLHWHLVAEKSTHSR